MSKTSSGMPQIGAAFNGWTQKITLLKHVENVVNGIVQIDQVPICFVGTIQPLSLRKLELKPEGQRSWTWLQIHSFAREKNLIPGDKITYNGDVFKVMPGMFDYSLNGYVEYHCARDYQNSGNP